MKPDTHNEGRRWLKQAERDYDDALYNLKGQRYNLVCFLSQQSAEKALKAFLYNSGEERVIGHSVGDLIRWTISLDKEFRTIQNARTLDLYYIPTRYPNGIPGGVPYEAFDAESAKKALNLAASVIGLVQQKVA
jgi:HEPN domain-containing protein